MVWKCGILSILTTGKRSFGNAATNDNFRFIVGLPSTMFISRWNIHLKSARVNGACAVGIRRVSLTITCESPVSSCRQTRRMHTENRTFLILETLKKLKIKNYLSRLKDRKFVLFKQAKTMQPASRPNVVHDSVQIGWIQMQVVDRRVSRCWLRLENLKLRCCSYPLDNSLRAHRRILELDFSTSRTHLIDYVGLLMLSAGKSVWIGELSGSFALLMERWLKIYLPPNGLVIWSAILFERGREKKVG